MTNGTLTIGKKAAAITVYDRSKYYGNNDPTLTSAVAGTVNGDVLVYTLSRE